MDFNSLVSSENLMEQIGIKKNTYYNDIRFLEIELIKNNLGKSYVTPENAERMKALRQWVEQTGSRKGFTENGKLVKSENGLATNQKEKSQLHYEDGNNDIYVEPESATANVNIDSLVRSAAELKAREIAMPDLVKRAIADELEEEELPEDLREKIDLARESANPKFTPIMVASSILTDYRANLAG